MEALLERYKEKALELPSRLSTVSLNSPAAQFAFITFACVLAVLLVYATAHAGGSVTVDGSGTTTTTLDEASGDAVKALACALRGNFGWLLIGCGCLLAIWDYFIQKQGHFLVAAVVGVLAIVILRNVLPHADCPE